MARKRKSSYNPGQLSLFDLIANNIEQIREENIQDDLRDEAASQVQKVIDEPPAQSVPQEPVENPVEVHGDEPVRLGINSKGSEVFVMPDGGRMFASIAGILNVVDGDHHSPEELYVKNKHDFLTIQEVAHFKNETNLVVEEENARQGHRISGNRRKGSKSKNDYGSEIGGLFSESIQNSGSLGVEQPGGTEKTGESGGHKIHVETMQPTAGGNSGPEQRGSEAGGITGDVGIGDIAEYGNRHESENYRITPEDKLGFGGAKAKYTDNIAAIRLLQKLEADGAKFATPEEQKILVRYVGWGGLPQVFDSQNEKWADEYREMRNTLAPERYSAARRSTQDAHYTSETVIRGIYQGLERLGLKQEEPLRILEPSEGIGNFIGLCPESINARFVAVEQDPTSAAIAQLLYPHGTHINNGFQNVTFGKNFFDAIIGNPPFGKQSLYDPSFPELKKFSIHNYFLAKSIELLREGGVAAFVVSRFFLDAADPSMREHIAQKADFLGAIRLPFTAFRQNALTDVTADIVFFQKNSGEKKYSREWLNTESEFVENIKNGGLSMAAINSYFLQNPGQMIGKMVIDGGMYEGALSCVYQEDALDLSNAISERLAILPSGVFVPRVEPELVETHKSKNERFIQSKYFVDLKKGAFCVEPQSGKIVFKISSPFGDNDYDYLEVKNDPARKRLAGMIEIRDTLRALLNEEKGNGDETKLISLRLSLNKQYDAFVRRHGHLNSQTNRGLMREDPEHSLLESLEVDYDKGLSADAAKKQGRPPRPASATKADIFRKRVLKPAEIVRRADSARDALLISLRETGRIDFGKMCELQQRPAEDIQRDLQSDGLIFQNPVTEQWEIREKYLSGNVREKLKVAEQYAQGDNRYAINVEALKAVQPAEIEAVDIGIKFGSSWVPAEVFSAFVEHLHNGKGYQEISYFPALGRWHAKVNIWDEAIDSSIYGIPEYRASKIIESLLINRPIKVEKESGNYDENGKPIMVVDQELTAAATQKADEIKQAFLDWVWTDDERRQMLAKMYNERFNTNVPPSYDGSHLELVGASEAVKLRPHQKNVVWRAIQEGTALFDHVVGAGKTLACIATIMESKRMGFISKPIVVVPNHLLFQWKDEFYKLYPDANILVAEKTDFTKQNRQRLFAKIATNDWDAVIVAHSSFKKIEMPRDVQEEILQEQIQMVIDAIESAKLANGSRSTIKQLEKQKEKMETRYQLLIAAAGKKDENVDFSDLGVDALFVDESHEFKNLCIQTSMNVSGLGNLAGSAKALDMFIKCRYLQMQHDGRGVYFMTGTPISNTIAEVYTLQRYLQYDDLKEKEIGSFDAWASTFGQINNGWELDATGVNYRLKSRFAKFQNVPELLAMYRSFADVVTKADLDNQAREAGERPLTPPVKNGKPFNDVAERSGDQSTYMDEIIHRMENLPADPRVDNPLKITNDARKAGLDYRLIDPLADDFEGSKVNAAVERIYQIWQNTASDKGTQLVFCDLSTPKGSKGFASAAKQGPDTVLGEDNGIIGGITDDSRLSDESDTVNESDPDEMAETIDMDSVVAMSSGNFSVYNDMKAKLIAKGIPADEIAFIHDANTDVRKAKLFSDMNAGHVRILFGSTSKMGAGMNVQKRLVAAHHLDAPWRPSDLEQRNGRIIRQGNMFYERDPDNFSVEIFNYATKQTYDARMWQTIEYKAAAIEQFRKGDLLQRVIDDVASEAANAAEMKAAASGNPLILIQVQLASELQKLEALYSQYQRSQYRMRDSLKWLNGSDERLAKAEAVYAENCRLRDANTSIVKEKDKEKIVVELLVDGKILGAKDGEKMQDRLLSGIKEVTRNAGASVLFGKYRGFEVYIHRMNGMLGGDDGFRLSLKGADGQQFKPMNLVYSFNDKLSLSGMFQRIDNFLAKGFEETIIAQREKAAKEKAELATVTAALGKEFPQKAELELVRQNHSDVMRELRRMQDEPGYVSEWRPQTLDASEKVNGSEQPISGNTASVESSTDEKTEAYWQKLEFENDEGKIEYSLSNQHNGYILDGYVLGRTRFDSHVGSLGQNLYEDGRWHTTATVPVGINFKQFASPDDALAFAYADARERGLESAITSEPIEKEPICSSSDEDQIDPILAAGFTLLGRDCLGWEEYGINANSDDGGIYTIRLSMAGEEVAVKVQYEKDNIVDARRTVKGNFDKVESALAFVKEYRVSPEELSNKDVKSRKRLSCG